MWHSVHNHGTNRALDSNDGDIEEETPYDLQAVEEKLARMQRERHARRTRTNAPKTALHPHEKSNARAEKNTANGQIAVPAADFELNAADDSCGSASEESDQDAGSISTDSCSDNDDVSKHGKRRSTRRQIRRTQLKDSLDLSMSMSIADLDSYHGKQQQSKVKTAPSDRKKPSKSLFSAPPPLRETSKPVNDQPDVHMSSGLQHLSNNDEEYSPPTLVQRRRQLEREAIAAKAVTAGSTVVPCVADQPHQMPPPPVQMADSLRQTPCPSINSLSATSQIRPEMQYHTHQLKYHTPKLGTTVLHQKLSNIEHESSIDRQCRTHTITATSEQAEPTNTRFVKSFVEQKSRLIPPTTVAFAHSMLKPRQDSKTTTAEVVPISNQCQDRCVPTPSEYIEHNRFSSVKVLSTEPPCYLSTATETSSSQAPLSQQRIAAKHISPPKPEEVDDLDTAAEDKLRQSLEKLNSRLTKLSAKLPMEKEWTPPTNHQQTHSNRPRQEQPKKANSPPASVDDDIEDDIDEKTLRAASYGGGTHCKLRQPTPVSARSSSLRRAQMSNGVVKARVRTGGVLMQETIESASLDRDGTHKVTVKKNLAHLLF